MTDLAKTIAELEEALKAATPGPWHHVQAFESVPAVRTIHGKVPGQRVDYVSTWPGPGTPKGHRVVIPMETVAEGHIVRTVSSEDMALIVAAVNALPELLERVKRLEEALKNISNPNTQITEIDEKYDEPVTFALDMWHAREIARAALKGTDP